MTLDELAAIVEDKGSSLERVFMFHWKQAGGANAPVPEWQWKFYPGRKWAFDFSWECGLAVEIDGGRWKAGGGKHATPEDYDKLNHAALVGYRVLRFNAEMLNNDPSACIDTVLKALGIERTSDDE